MELELIRTYFPNGTNGEISIECKLICFSIELPWKDNLPNISCIPEGRYALEKIHTEKFGWHLHLLNVKGRGLVMIHPANDALKDLRGCIAPVLIHSGPGRGLRSRFALEALLAKVFPVLEEDQQVFITIKSINMNLIERAQAPTPTFFKKLRNIALILAAVSGTIIAAPVALPTVIIQVATYLRAASTIASAVSQVTVQGESQ